MSEDRTPPSTGRPGSGARSGAGGEPGRAAADAPDRAASPASGGASAYTPGASAQPSGAPAQPSSASARTSAPEADSTRQVPVASPAGYRDPDVVDAPDRATVVARQKASFGGVKPFVAFFGWLTATGMLVLLSAVLAAVGASVSQVVSPGEVADAVQGSSAEELTWVGVVVVLVLILVAYYAGGYVAGRMARFDGMRQGVAVWLWGVVIAVALAAVGYFFDTTDTVLSSINNIALPTSGLSTQGIVGVVGLIVLSLLGAVLGGLAGMHFHRKVDREGLGR